MSNLLFFFFHSRCSQERKKENKKIAGVASLDKRGQWLCSPAKNSGKAALPFSDWERLKKTVARVSMRRCRGRWWGVAIGESKIWSFVVRPNERTVPFSLPRSCSANPLRGGRTCVHSRDPGLVGMRQRVPLTWNKQSRQVHSVPETKVFGTILDISVHHVHTLLVTLRDIVRHPQLHDDLPWYRPTHPNHQSVPTNVIVHTLTITSALSAKHLSVLEPWARLPFQQWIPTRQRKKKEEKRKKH